MQSTIAYTCPVGARARSLRQSNIPKHRSRAELARIFAVLGGALHSRRRGGICVDLHHQMVCSDMEQRDKLFCIAKHEAAPTTSSARRGSASHAARVRWPFWRCWKAIGSGCSPAVEEAAREQYPERSASGRHEQKAPKAKRSRDIFNICWPALHAGDDLKDGDKVARFSGSPFEI